MFGVWVNVFHVIIVSPPVQDAAGEDGSDEEVETGEEGAEDPNSAVPPGFLSSTWSFIVTFFMSLIPEGPQNANWASTARHTRGGSMFHLLKEAVMCPDFQLAYLLHAGLWAKMGWI